jgi:tetratricopeptide (TPR) repeat protein
VRRLRSQHVGALAALLLLSAAACGWSPSRPFDRESPEVNQAIRALDAGDATVAATTLEDYLSTGPCADSNIGTPELLRKRPNGSFDLGLSLFRVGEAFGRRFGEEEDESAKAVPGGPGGQKAPGDGADEKQKALRGDQVGCAVRILGVVTGDPNIPTDLRARARYLEGNLDFLDGRYKEAVAAYDKALSLAPGENDGGDPVGRDAAWNRAIALKRIEDQKDSGQDSGNDGGNEGGQDGGNEGGGDAGKEGGPDAGGDSGGKDSGGDSGESPDSGSPEGGQPPPEQQPDAAPPPPPRANEDDRMLDQLENAPTVQQEAAKKMAAHRKVRGMADK